MSWHHALLGARSGLRASTLGRRRHMVAGTSALLMSAILISYVVPVPGRAATSTIAMSPSQGVSGTSVTVTGRDFTPKMRVQLAWDGSIVGMPSAAVNGRGAFRTKFTVPRSKAGGHAVAVVDGASTTLSPTLASFASVITTATFTVDVTAVASASPTPAPTPAHRGGRRHATVFAATLRQGGGIRMKTLEALAAGAAVVTTSLGAQGLGARSGDTF